MELMDRFRVAKLVFINFIKNFELTGQLIYGLPKKLNGVMSQPVYFLSNNTAIQGCRLKPISVIVWSYLWVASHLFSPIVSGLRLMFG